MTSDEYQRERMATWRAVMTGLLTCPEDATRQEVVKAADFYLDMFDSKFSGCVSGASAEPEAAWRPCSKEEALANFNDSQSKCPDDMSDGWHELDSGIADDYCDKCEFRTSARKSTP